MHALLIGGSDGDELYILSQTLHRAGLTTNTATRIDDAIDLWDKAPGDVILVSDYTDDYLSTILRMRKVSIVPLILITDPLKEDIHISLLNQGVDLVFFRPFSSRLVASQVPALLRRCVGLPLNILPPLHQLDFTLEPSTRTVQTKDGSRRTLSHLEFRLLYALMLHQGQVLPSENIVERVWGYTGEGDKNLVRNLIRRVRLKIEPNPGVPTYIISIPGIGYSFA